MPLDSEPVSAPRRRSMEGAAAGLATAAVALGAAELVAGLHSTFRSPVFDVADRVIDAVPSWIREFAIETLGTNTKVALVVGVLLLLAAFATVIGVVAVELSLVAGVAAVVMFGAVGGVAAVLGDRGVAAAVPSMVGTASAVLTLTWLAHLIAARPKEDDAELRRRRVLRGLAATAGLAAVSATVGRILAMRFRVPLSQRMGELPAVDDAAPVVPSGADLGLPGLSPFLTSNEAFYRIDTALAVPQLDLESFRLRVTGMVDRPLELSYGDLVDRTQTEAVITLACVSNEVGGRLVGTARWQGVLLEELLADAGVRPGADQIVGRSFDGFTCGFPVSAARNGRDAMVAIGMNGVRLPLPHGFPARLVVPGLYGYVSATKWLVELELTTFAAFDHYWERQGWAEQAPIKTQSRIDVPRSGRTLPAGPGVIAGVAWAPTRGIDRVEVRVDGGPWLTADLADSGGVDAWRQFSIPWQVTPGAHTITCRATDGTGFTQPEERTRPAPDGAQGWHTIEVFGA